MWIESAKNAIEAIINNIKPGVLVIDANQNAPRPTGDYITLLLTPITGVGSVDILSIKQTGETFSRKRIEQRNFTIALQCIANEPVQMLEDIKLHIKTENNLELLRNEGVAFVDAGEVLDISSISSGYSDIESRAAMDLFLRIGVSFDETVDIIENIEGTGVFNNPDGSEILQEDISVSPPAP